MNSRNKVIFAFLLVFVAGFIYLFLTNTTPYEDAVLLEKKIESDMKDIAKEGIQWIRIDSSSVQKIEKKDYLFIEESFVRVDSVNADSVGIYSPKGSFDFSKQDLIIAKSFLFKNGTLSYEYARRGILLEEVQKKKKEIEDAIKKEEAKKQREKKD